MSELIITFLIVTILCQWAFIHLWRSQAKGWEETSEKWRALNTQATKEWGKCLDALRELERRETKRSNKP